MQCRLVNDHFAIYPENCVYIDATGRSRVVQLEPLVQREIGIGQQTGQRDSQTAQCLDTVGILHLVHSKLREAKK